MSQQLVKKDSDGRYSNVMPKSWIEAIKDKNTGQTLVEILQGFNMYFLSYNGNTSATRCLVPTTLRKKGLWITYVKYDGNVYTEWYAASDIDDESWGNSSNWRIGNNTLVGDITISASGNWVINGTETEFKAIGEKGNTPLLRVANNKLQVSYNLGETYLDVTDNPVYTKFRWSATSGDIQANNVGRIQASTDEGKTWVNMSNDFINNLHISKYIGANEPLPTSGIAEGTIYAKGPTYAVEDTSNSNPIYRLWVYAWKNNILAWQDNGEFTSITAGIVQETGSNENAVMSQKATTKAIHEILYDVSANNDGAVFESLQALLSSPNLYTLIPTSVRHGGMSIRFIQGTEQSSDNKYVQFRCTADEFTTDVTQWQGVDDEPNNGSNNLVKSGGVKMVTDSLNQFIHSVKSEIDGNSSFKIDAEKGIQFGMSGFIIGNYACAKIIKGTYTFPTLNSKYFYNVIKYISDVEGEVIRGWNSNGSTLTIDDYFYYNFKNADNSPLSIEDIEYLNSIQISSINNENIENKITVTDNHLNELNKQVGYQIIVTVGDPVSTNVKLPVTIPRGTKIFSVGDCQYINGRTNATDSSKIEIRENTILDRDVNYVNFSGSGVSAGSNVTIISSTILNELVKYLSKITDISHADYTGVGYVKSDGTIANSDAWTYWKFYNAENWKQLNAVLSVNSNTPRPIAFYRSSYLTTNNLISVVDPVVENDHYYSVNIPEGTKCIVVCSRTATEGTTPSADIYTDEVQDYSTLQRVNSLETYGCDEYYDSVGRADHWLLQPGLTPSDQKIPDGSDMTWVGNNLVIFDPQAGNTLDYDSEEAANIRIYEFANGVNNLCTNVYTAKHKFGHCNTVDYCEENDSLILGNGSGNYGLAGEIFIIPVFSKIIEAIKYGTAEVSPTDIITIDSSTIITLTFAKAIVIDCSSYNLGTKFNLVWGDDSDGRYRIAYLITAKMGATYQDRSGNDNGVIRKLVLAKYDEQGDYGTLVTNTRTSFNGTFNIAEVYTQETAGYEVCNQGTCYYQGEIIAGIGHDGLYLWKMRCAANGHIYKKVYKQNGYYDLNGNFPDPRSTNGVCVKDGYLYIGRMGIMAIRL